MPKSAAVDVHGLVPGTRRIYLRYARGLLATQRNRSGPLWADLTADDVADFVRTQAARLTPTACRLPVTATRAILRFLALTGVRAPGLEAAVPPIRQWKHAALPRYLTREQVEAVLATSEAATVGGGRNQAILVLLARLGVRAGEIAALGLDDIDWRAGRIRIRAGKWYLSATPEIDALLRAPDRATWAGRRDHALFLTLYNTGARVSEITALRRADVTFATPPAVQLHGKGRKERAVPLWARTARVLRAWFEERGGGPDAVVFPNARGRPLTRHGVAHLLTQAIAQARAAQPSLATKRVSPHVLRHTTAMHLLHAGVDPTVIALWLGHESVETTHRYVEADLTLKEQTLAHLPPVGPGARRFKADDALLGFLAGVDRRVRAGRHGAHARLWPVVGVDQAPARRDRSRANVRPRESMSFPRRRATRSSGVTAAHERAVGVERHPSEPINGVHGMRSTWPG